MSEFYKCDVCGVENESVVAGRWLFYCPEHKSRENEMIYDNEIKPSLEDDPSYILGDGELQDWCLENL